LHEAVAEMAAVIETELDGANDDRQVLVNASEPVRAARSAFDARVRAIYGLSEEQFYQLFPYRREVVPRSSDQ